MTHTDGLILYISTSAWAIFQMQNIYAHVILII